MANIEYAKTSHESASSFASKIILFFEEKRALRSKKINKQKLAASRNRLAQLSPHLLRDIGVRDELVVHKSN